MPHFAKDELDQFEHQLMLQRAPLIASIGQRLHQGDTPAELALANTYQQVREQAEADLLADTDIAQLQIELAELEAIEGALARLRDGSYGRCARCGTPISTGRLRVQPAARMCLPCQEAAEQRR